jgi:hypothetical protein
MNGHLDEAALMARPTAEIGQLRTRSMIVGAVGLALVLVGYFTARGMFMQSYLIAFIFWMGLTMGSLAVLMVQYLSGGAWGIVARRILEAATRNLPLMAVLFLPIAWKLPVLYSWARPDALADPVIQKKAAYLNANFFYGRALLFFAIWGILIFLLNRWSKQQDESPQLLPGPEDARFRVLSGPGIVLYVLTLTLMSVDWIMSLDPHWYSTIFGILLLGGQGLSTMAFTIFVLSRLVRFKPMSEVVSAENFHDLSKLMFAFTMLWAYFSVSQLIIIWSANLPEEIPFYLARFNGPWAPVSVAVLVGQFVLPFLILLSRSLKRNPAAVARVALFILLMRVTDIAWTIGPMVRPAGSGLHWLDFAMVAGMGFFWMTSFWRNLAGRALLPARDPYFKEEMAHDGH